MAHVRLLPHGPKGTDWIDSVLGLITLAILIAVGLLVLLMSWRVVLSPFMTVGA